MAYSPLAGGWLSGKYRKGREVSGPGSAARLQRWPGRFDASNPANAAKLDAADALGALADEAGLTLIQMAVAFAVRHPAVTSASSARAPWSTWTPTSPPTGSNSQTTCSTASTRSSHRESRSTSPTTCGMSARKPSVLDSAAVEILVRPEPPLPLEIDPDSCPTQLLAVR